MANYFITTDDTSDFPPELAKEDFRILPMTYVVDGVLYDGVERPFLSPKEFYSLLAEGKESTTSMVPVETARAFFDEILKEGKDILHISFSSSLSGSYEGYRQAAAEAMRNYPGRKVAVVDSLCASGGEGLLNYYALKKREEGASLEENIDYISDLRNHIGHIFTVDDMYHLYRGGRVSRGAAIVGQAIKLKPVLMVSEEGRLVPTNSVIGRKIALRTLVDKMAAKGKGYDNDVVLISHGDAAEDAKFVAEKVNERFGRQNIVFSDVGPVVGSHCGKGMVALFFLCSDKKPFVR